MLVDLTDIPEHELLTPITQSHYGWGHNGELYPAIGKVAVRSALLDDLLREILSEIIDDSIWYIFEGQSTDWLVRMLRDAFEWHNVNYFRWTQAEQERFLAALSPSDRLRNLRNSVMHGLWSTWSVGSDEEPTLSRPWGGDDRTPGVLVCTRSRQRKGGSEQFFTVGDVERLALEYQKLTQEVANVFYDMDRRNKRGKLLPRWVDRPENLPDFRPPPKDTRPS